MRKSPLPLEFFIDKQGKRFLNNRTTRALQSKINLKFPFASLEKEKIKMKPSIKQSIIDDFEKAYTNNCNQSKQRTKNRNVSHDSPFDPFNKPPKEYLIDDPNFLDKPGRMNVHKLSVKQQPLAGRLTEIGEQILLIGSQKAKFICTGNWEFKNDQKKNGKKSHLERDFGPGFEKVTSFNAFTFTE
mmetsp:Transcript_21855/g.33872  ORF Transcript_21855/g.33872 Transcript_21855/m.33872 type:complete len:186 (+) Transcript_21855:465-1022(+)